MYGLVNRVLFIKQIWVTGFPDLSSPPYCAPTDIVHVATHDLLAIESLLACPSLELDCEFISGALTGSLAWHISDKSSLMKNELSTVSLVSVVGKTSHVWGKYSLWWWENMSHSRKIRLQKCPASSIPVGYCLP